MGDTTPLTLPTSVPFPITITRLLVSRGTAVRRGDKLLEYSFLSATRRRENEQLEREGKKVPSERWQDDMVGSWESPVDGTTTAWEKGVKPGLEIDRRQANKPLISVEQACTHPVQIHGMCGVCGADITNDDYLSRPEESDNRVDSSRVPDSFEMSHDALGVKVSTKEARRLETLSRDTLLESRRLSLIVDLDQTIIHTTVDPTVGEWLTEIEEDDKEEAEKSSAGKEKDDGAKNADGEKAAGEEGPDGRSTTPPMSPSHKREKNPNAKALRDVAAFQLADDVPPGYKGRPRAAPRRWYYTKPRPGLPDFLENMSKMYEMHVYTMGTRTYADEICKIIDPTGKIFGGRILSRDESGSMSSKSLMRLFPTDQSMVVVIDDRSDVWGDCPNLLKVVPYDFFIGIGDINGSFLPPTKPAVAPMPKQGDPSTPSTAPSSPPPETPPQIPSTEEGLLLQSKLLDELAQKRPLAKLEQESEEDDDDEEEEDKEKEPSKESASGEDSTTKPDGPTEEKKEADGAATDASAADDEAKASPEAKAAPVPPQHHHHHHHHHRKQLLNPDDDELDRVASILTEVHTMYYDAYDSRNPKSSSLPLQCDTPLLLGEIKDEVLSGCTLAFTGVIPRNVSPENSEIWLMAETFGATCVNELNDSVTHLITATQGTEKMYKAYKMVPKTGIKIVWLQWLQKSMALWKREPEEPYIARQPGAPEAAPPSRPQSIDGDVTMADGEKEKKVDNEQVKEEEKAQDLASLLASAWDDDAQAELDAFLAEGSDDDLSGSDSDKEGSNNEGSDKDNSDDEDVPRSRSRAGTPSTWSRAATPGPSILSRAGSPGLGEPKHVRYADEENLPLEEVREPQPGDIPSFPPRKKPRLLPPPTDDDDVPEANKMVYNASKPAWQGGSGSGDDDLPPGSQESHTSAESAGSSDDEEDEVRLAGKLRALDVRDLPAASESGPGPGKLLAPSPMTPLPARMVPSPLSTVTTADTDETDEADGSDGEKASS